MASSLLASDDAGGDGTANLQRGCGEGARRHRLLDVGDVNAARHPVFQGHEDRSGPHGLHGSRHRVAHTVTVLRAVGNRAVRGTGASVAGAFVTGAFVTGAFVTGAFVTGAFVTFDLNFALVDFMDPRATRGSPPSSSQLGSFTVTVKVFPAQSFPDSLWNSFK